MSETNEESGLLVCPACGTKWEHDSEQAICIEKHGECVVCRFSPSGKGSRSGTMKDLDNIALERKRRMRSH